MADRSPIEWTDSTWNPLVAYDRDTGKRGWFCTKVSPGCTNCYAESINARLGNGHLYRKRNRDRVRWDLAGLDKPLRWRKPRRVFVNSMTDLFHEDVPDSFVDRVFAVMALAPQHVFQVLTKRPERMAAWFARERKRTALSECLAELYVEHPEIVERWPLDRERAEGVGLRGWPLPNVWLGTSVEDQAAANERIPHLLRTPAAVRFLSCEPLLGPVELRAVASPHDPLLHCLARGFGFDDRVPRVDWVIVGGESGPGARPMDIAWARSLVRFCRDSDVPVFVKQMGKWIAGSHEGFTVVQRWLMGPGHHWVPPLIGPHEATQHRPPDAIAFGITDPKGGRMDEWPEDLRVREFPERPVPA